MYSAERLAGRFGFAVNDLYRAAAPVCEYRLDNGYHYRPAGQRAQAAAVAGALRPLPGSRTTG